MNRRAEVYREVDGRWWVDVVDRSHWSDRNVRIAYRPLRLPEGLAAEVFYTHAEALTHALAEVGLDKPAEHREAP